MPKRGPQRKKIEELRKRLLRQKGEELEKKAPGIFKPDVLARRRRERDERRERKKREKK